MNEFEDYSVQFIGVYAPNIHNWYVLDIACLLFGITIAPLYDTLGGDTVKIVLEEVNNTTLCLSESHVKTICELKMAGSLPNLKNIILMDCNESVLA